MMNLKMKNALDELMEFGYEYNLIASMTMREHPELESQFEKITERCVKYCTDWFNTSGENFSIAHQRSTIHRFCLLLGMGSAWLWENRREEAETKGLYECMAEPRTEFYMDEYIEDMVGIWFSSESKEDLKLMLMSERTQSIIEKYFDLGDPQQQFDASRTIMQFGMQHEYTRLYRESAIESYDCEGYLNFAILSTLLNHKEGTRKEEMESFVEKLGEEGCRSGLVYTAQENSDSEFAKLINCYYSATIKNDDDLGARVVLSVNSKNLDAVDAFPIFDSQRRFPLTIEAVYEHDGGATASIVATFSDYKDRSITFYDTDYLKNKQQYFAGQTYMFDIYGVAQRVRVLPKEQRTFQLEGKEAINFKSKIGKETVYDEGGNPKPAVISVEKMHAFIQNYEDMPDLADFAAPIERVYEDVDFFENKVYEVEIGLMNFSEIDEQMRRISVYIPACIMDTEPVVEEPIQGTLCLYGRMLSRVDAYAPRSKKLHTFDAKTKEGNTIFKHHCSPCEVGQPLSAEEKAEFAKDVYSSVLGSSISEWVGDEDNAPDFVASRGRAVWVKADVEYMAKEAFLNDTPDDYMRLYYARELFPVIAYVTLYDNDGNKCQWLKGGEYTATISYGSMLTGQKSELVIKHKQIALEDKAANAFGLGLSSVLEKYLDKDVDFRSRSFDDPIITREEFVRRFDIVARTIKRKYNKAVEVIWPNKQPGVVLKYPYGDIDRVYVKAENGLITSMVIESIVEAVRNE